MTSQEAAPAGEITVTITFTLPAIQPDLLEALRHYVEFGRPLKHAIVDGGGTASITVNGTPVEELES